MKISIFSFFSGIGFLDLGFETEGYKIVYVNEYHDPFLKAYQYAREKMHVAKPIYGYNNGSIENLLDSGNDRAIHQHIHTERRTANLIGFIGGPPCPDFSVGGKNRGQTGENGRLSEIYVELITRIMPDLFLFENVKGLWKTRRHREFYEYLKTLLKARKYVLTERLINTIEYGAPQDRERIILLGIKSTLVNELCLPFDRHTMMMANSTFPWLKYAKYPDRTAFTYNWPNRDRFVINSELPKPQNIPAELTVEYWFQNNAVMNHPNTTNCFTPRAGLKRFISVDEGDDSKKSYKRLHRWRYSPTAAYGNNEVHLHPYKPRRISVAEALAIQSLPKAFELPQDMSLTDMFKGTGNGVPYLAAKMIARSLMEVVQSGNKIDFQ